MERMFSPQTLGSDWKSAPGSITSRRVNLAGKNIHAYALTIGAFVTKWREGVAGKMSMNRGTMAARGEGETPARLDMHTYREGRTHSSG